MILSENRVPLFGIMLEVSATNDQPSIRNDRHGSSRVGGWAQPDVHRGEQLERFCTTMRHWHGAILTKGTSLERIAAESLTRSVSDFVHRDI